MISNSLSKLNYDGFNVRLILFDCTERNIVSTELL